MLQPVRIGIEILFAQGGQLTPLFLKTPPIRKFPLYLFLSVYLLKKYCRLTFKFPHVLGNTGLPHGVTQCAPLPSVPPKWAVGSKRLVTFGFGVFFPLPRAAGCFHQ